MSAPRTVPRAETVGSLLRPPDLRAAVRAHQEGHLSAADLRARQDAAVLEAIELQESIGLDVITDGEMRRDTWAITSRYLDCLEPRAGEQSYPASVAAGAARPDRPAVVRRLSAPPGPGPGQEYTLLAQRARSRTKFTIAAPSYHRRLWSDEHSTQAYPSVEDFLYDVRDWIRAIVRSLAALGCDYVQLDAPNYGSLCDPTVRAYHAERGHDVDAVLAFDADLDSSVFDGMAGVTGALHVCRGNRPDGSWFSSGGYGAIAETMFPRLRMDTLLLEYDSERAGDFHPLRHVPAGTVVVLGLLTTKSAQLEQSADVQTRIEEAAQLKPLDELALSTQCGFASVPGQNPVGPAEQRAKLELIVSTADRIWR